MMLYWASYTGYISIYTSHFFTMQHKLGTVHGMVLVECALEALYNDHAWIFPAWSLNRVAILL